MYDLLQRINPGDLTALITIMLMVGVVVLVVGGMLIVGGLRIWFNHHRREIEAELKRDMIAAGMSADDIVRVLNAGNRSKDAADSQPPSPT